MSMPDVQSRSSPCSSHRWSAAAALAFVRDYRWSARLNILASFVVLLFALLLFRSRPPVNDLLLADDLNVVFIALNAFVGFTTSIFSASYIGHELETGRLTPGYLRFYHVMFQLMMFGMDLALTANNIGLMWVADRTGHALDHHDGRHLPDA